MICKRFLTTLSVVLLSYTPLCAAEVTVSVNPQKVVHKMAGGIGASWHSISKEFKIDVKDLHGWKDSLNCRGSAWGGNPPVENQEAWNDILDHASWLGMNWVRVELSQRMYEPRRKQFDWANEEMQALYRMLDWCEKNHVDVFLTQMWGFVDWNSFEGVHPLQSGPKSIDDFADGFAEMVEHLTRKKKYTCIRWLCISNEPDLPCGWWLGPDKKPMPLGPALKAVRARLDEKKIKIPLSGPDWCYMGFNPQHVIDADTEASVGAYDSHNYGGTLPAALNDMTRFVQRARKRGIPFFLTEFGDMRLGWQYSNVGPRTYNAGLSNAEVMIRAMNMGVDAMNRWSFTNRGDLDGNWQLLRTWDTKKKQYYGKVEPETVPYYTFGIFSRFNAKHSEVLETKTQGPNNFMATALRSPKGNLTLYVLNRDTNAHKVKIDIQGLKKSRKLYRYRVTEADIRDPNFKLEPSKTVTLSKAADRIEDDMPPLSIFIYSTYNLQHTESGIIAE